MMADTTELDDVLNTSVTKPNGKKKAKPAPKTKAKAAAPAKAAKAAAPAKAAKAAAPAAKPKAAAPKAAAEEVSTTAPDDSIVLKAVGKLKEPTLASNFAAALGIHRRTIRTQLQRLAEDKANGVKMVKKGFNWIVESTAK